MGFILDGLEAEAYDRTYTDRELMRRIFRYFKVQLPRIYVLVILIVLVAVLDVAVPFLTSRGIDLLPGSQAMRITLLLVGFILMATALSWVGNIYRQWLTARVVGDVVMQLRKDAFAATMSQDMSFFDEFSSGKIVSRVASDTGSLASVVTLTLELTGEGILFVLALCILFFRDVQLALVALLIIPVIFAVSLGFRILARRFTRHAQRSLARVNANVQEVLNGITIAKNFRQEQQMYQEFQQVNAQSYVVNVRSDFLYKAIFPVLILVTNVCMAILVYTGGLGVLNRSITAGDWFLFLQSVVLLWLPLTSIASFWSQFQLGLAAGERVFALLDAVPHVRQIEQRPLPALRGEIIFKHVTFGYGERQPVFTDFNLTIQAGETVALVGHTGAGKTSLGRLIARFYEFQAGQILIDGQDIRTLDLRQYRRQLGIISQSPFLFSGTIADNIRYGFPQATDEEVEAVAQCLGGGDWLKALPDGLATPVGEEGKMLSRGQRQLVAMARVLLQNPAIIIMDEATASVDPFTEAQIREGLEVILKGRTALIIAHRLSTIRRADRILVLTQGHIIEEGRHEALMKQGGHYANLYTTYFRHQSIEYQPEETP